MGDGEVLDRGLEIFDSAGGVGDQGGDVRHALVELGAGAAGPAREPAEHGGDAAERQARLREVLGALAQAPQAIARTPQSLMKGFIGR